jgi:hypothetical protein
MDKMTQLNAVRRWTCTLGKSFLTATPATEYHLYALEWYEDHLETFVDGVSVLRFENDGLGNPPLCQRRVRQAPPGNQCRKGRRLDRSRAETFSSSHPPS